ncbi:hypothetical protein [Listeria valentina]|uniref:hypothetical protein n=1 Tax=Listeria valentina TaxID=2705293 RepID=UPI00142FE6B2|nr:hypothetical protein [Listeria valentina]
MKKIINYLEGHIEPLIDYWLSTYYAKSDEYELRKNVDGFLDAQRKETLSLFHKAFENIHKGSYVVPLFEEIGEDRRDMNTSFKDVYTNYHAVYTAAIEFLDVQIQTGKVDFSLEEYSKFILFFRKLEINSGRHLFEGFLQRQDSSY